MFILDATTKTLECITSVAGSIDVSVSSVTHPSFVPVEENFNIITAATITISSAPNATEQKQIKLIAIVNKATSANRVTLQLNNNSSLRQLFVSTTLQPGESLQYTDGNGFAVFDSAGRIKQASLDNQSSLVSKPYELLKVGTAFEAAGVPYFFGKDSGSPGAWAVGTPGLAGRALTGSAEAGCVPVTNPAAGFTNFLTEFTVSPTGALFIELDDFLWVNSGIVVTTTTAQTINSVSFPARDNNGSANGEGVNIGLLVTTATTQAGAVTTITVSYTNSDGVAGRTATMTSFPATAVIGSFIKFQLQAGDKGVRSVQSITLGTTLTAGAVSLVAYRVIGALPISSAQIGAGLVIPNPGIRLFNDSTLFPVGISSGTGAITINGKVNVVER